MTTRRLIFLRHAKSDWPVGVADLDRPLGDRGRLDAVAVGRALAVTGLRPDLALCSIARRTRSTWQRAADSLEAATPGKRDIPVRYVEDLYDSSAGVVIDLVRELPPDVHTVVVIGHEPTTSHTVSLLARDAVDPDELDQLRTKYPTSGLAVLRLDGEWSEVEPDSAILESFSVPRG